MADITLIGFDAREGNEHDARWDRVRRGRYLLREDVARPLSVGVLAWPSVFDTGQGIALPRHERMRRGFAGLPIPGWIGANAGLWESLHRMRGHIDDSHSDPSGIVLVAVGWLSAAGFRDGSHVGPHRQPAEPSHPSNMWELLGYDVADGSLLSGLAECGYADQEAERLRARWSPHLNEHHLFREETAAFEFAEFSNARVAEHAPFFVYGIYRVT